MMKANLLGPFQLRNVNGNEIRFPTTKTKALFAYLATQKDVSHSREILATLLWSESPQVRARANLRQTLTRIRQSIPDSASKCIATEGDTVCLSSQFIDTDVDEFERLTEEAALAYLEQAGHLYRNDFLEGLIVDEEPFIEWLRATRTRLREKAIRCFEILLEQYKGTGASTRGIAIANRLLELEPHREPIHRLLMSFYANQDRLGAALDQYNRCERILQSELGIEPEEETTELYENIKSHSFRTIYTEHPELSRDGADRDQVQRSSSTVTNLVKRSPWHGANWEKPSIAVLPFDCFVPGEDHRYVADGIVEDVVTNLARFREIHVIARNSAFSYRGRNCDLKQIGRELGARYLVEGSVQNDGNYYRVSAQLIESETGYHIWAENYDEKMNGLFSLRDRLTSKIVGNLVGQVEQHNLDEIKVRNPGDWAAYECWLKGMDALRTISFKSFEEATRYFNRALEIDPTYARAYSGLAMAQFKAWSYLNWTAWWKLEEKALGYANKAIELDENDHHIHCILGVLALFTSDYKKSRYHLEKAEQINPHDARTLANAAIAWMLMGEREKAVHMAELAVRLDPFHPDWYLTALGAAYYVAGDYERAVAAMELAPNGLCDTAAYYAAALARRGNISEATFQGQQFIQISCEHLGGDPEKDAARFVSELIQTNPFQNPKDAAHFTEGLRLANLPVASN